MARSKNRCRIRRLVFLQIFACAALWAVPAGAESGNTNSLQRTVTVRVVVPWGSGTVYLAGNLPELGPWSPHKFAMNGHGSNRIAVLHLPADSSLEFKFTLGSWESVETTSAGDDVPNRTYTVPATGEATYVGTVGAWKSTNATTARKSTATASVSVLTTNFAMPQLGRTRRIWLYLPPDYATSTNTYPVLYMHDGQNVFDDATSFAGEWGVDETLDQLHAQGDPGCMVVAVDNDGQHRMEEYQPDFKQNDGGEGGKYVDFLVHTLKPYIDQHYRTRPDRINTGIAGSSLGGIISLYAGLKYPDVFGRVCVFSAPLYMQPKLSELALQAKPLKPATRFYFLCGLKETTPPDRLAKLQQQMVESLAVAGFKIDDLRTVVSPDGQHAEWFWRREFPAAYKWLFTPVLVGQSP
ncbi:MAG TPA: alpha/beta hydrolase-fold protein [Verrucomicrobiae bacterium]|jgi:predicted alpha/beta superfamily hydrolase|nr:alpha/beta hydrolase-fold protein [Verrucomicrobiae bacterium]